MEALERRDLRGHHKLLRGVATLFAVAVLALCAYAGGQARGARRPVQAKRDGVSLTAIKARATSGKPARSGPSANVGQQINLVGSGFDGNVSVEFTAFANSTFSVLPLKVKAKRVTVAVPGQVVTGGVRLIDPEAGNSNALSLQIVPKIVTLTPETPAPGTRLLIDGDGFTPDTRVTFKGVADPVRPTVVSPTRIDLLVPVAAQTGRITVVTNGGTSKPVKLKIAGASAAAPAPAPKATNHRGRRGPQRRKL